MRYKRYSFSNILVVILLLSTYILVGASETPDQKLIKTYDEDVTGDSHKETISLYGIPLAGDSDYYKDIWAVIIFPNQSEKKVTYKGGYEPELTFVDMTQNHINDILFHSTINQQDKIIHYQLHSITKNNLSDIPLPTQDHIKGSYKDEFIIELQITPKEDKKVINVENRAKEYIEAGLYTKRGKLLRRTSVHPQQAMKYEPVFLSSSKGYGLKSHQQIKGINKSDKLGSIETLWYYEADKWIILQSKWKPATKS